MGTSQPQNRRKTPSHPGCQHPANYTLGRRDPGVVCRAVERHGGRWRYRVVCAWFVVWPREGGIVVKQIQGRTVAAAVVVALLGATISGCTGDERVERPSESRPGPSAEVVDGQATTVVSPSGVVVTIQAGDASEGTLTIAETSPPEGKPEPASTRIPGDPVEVTLSGGELTGTASIEFPIESDSALALPLVERFNELTGAWEPVSVEDIEINDDSVSVETSHFSWYRPSWLSVDRMAAFMRDRWFDVFGDGLAGAQKPTCPGDAETLEQFTWTSSSDDTLFWCVGTNDDGAVIANIVNNNRYPVGLTVSQNMRQLGKFGGSWSAAALGAEFDEWGSGQVILEPREGVTFHLIDGTNGEYKLTTDFTLLTWSIGMLGVALSAYIDVWTRSGTDLDTVHKKLAFSISATACVAELGPKLLSDPGLWTATRALLVEVFGCAGDVFKEALQSEGWWTQNLASVVGFITGPVIGGFEGLVALGEISVDSLAQRATYDLTMTPRPKPTPAQINLQDVAAGDYSSMMGTWTPVASATNPHDGTGEQWRPGSLSKEVPSTLSISNDTITYNGSLTVQGGTLTVDFGSGPESVPFLFDNDGNYISGGAELGSTYYSVDVYPKGSVDLDSELGVNNGVTLDDQHDVIAFWSSSNGSSNVFARTG